MKHILILLALLAAGFIRASDGEVPGWATMTEQVSAEIAYGPQWSHPHPSFNPDDRWVSFTSDRDGHPQASVVAVQPR